MLNMLRRSVSGWTAKILLGLLVLSFAVWGIGGAIPWRRRPNAVLTAGETDVSPQDYALAYNRAEARVAQQIGRRPSAQEAQMFGVDQSVLSQLMAGAVLDEQARRIGLGMSEDELAKQIAERPDLPRFQRATSRAPPSATSSPTPGSARSSTSPARRSPPGGRSCSRRSRPAPCAEDLRNRARPLQRRAPHHRLFHADGGRASRGRRSGRKGAAELFRRPQGKVRRARIPVDRLCRADPAGDQRPLHDHRRIRSRPTTRRTRTSTPRRSGGACSRSSSRTPMPQRRRRPSSNSGESFEQVAKEAGKSVADTELGLLTKRQIPDAKLADAAFSLAEGRNVGRRPGRLRPGASCM